MARTFKSAWENLKPEKKGPGSRLMRDFEASKRDFGTQRTMDRDKKFEIEFLIPGASDSEHYDADEGLVVFTSTEMKSFIRPVMLDIEKLLDDQIRQLNQVKPWSKIKKVVLAGGFGDSPYLNNTLGAWCGARGIGLICPADPQASVVKGAALAALKNSRPQKRKSRLHYGVHIWKEFREGVDPDNKAAYNQWDGRKVCNDRMEWIIEKGDSIGKEDKLTYDLVQLRFENQSLASSIEVLTHDGDSAPEWFDRLTCRNVGKLCWEFKKSDLELFESKKHSNGQTMWQMAYIIVFDLFADKGVLQFKALGPRNENLGEIAIEYNGADDQGTIGPQERKGTSI